MVLTIGMAVDANVLIFERIREESAKGKSLRGALSAGYDRAFSTIFDSHVTTLISSVILIYMGTGPIKGFGVTLTIGVAASLFTALVVTRLIFDFVISRGWVKELKMFHIIRATKLDFMKLAMPAFALSWTIILVGLAYGYFVRGDKMLGIDFKGGDNMTLAFKQKVDPDQIRVALKSIQAVKDPIIQYQKDATSTNELLRITSDYGTSSNVLSTLTNTFASAGFESRGSEVVGPTIGKEIQSTAIIASLLSLFGILVYVAFRYEFSFAVGAVVAVIHDVLMTIGCYCLTGLFGPEHAREFNATMVAAILTIIGFSINDTIVIFDRIREDLKLGVRGSFKDVINQALNQTLSRTLITSGTVFIATTLLATSSAAARSTTSPSPSSSAASSRAPTRAFTSPAPWCSEVQAQGRASPDRAAPRFPWKTAIAAVVTGQTPADPRHRRLRLKSPPGTGWVSSSSSSCFWRWTSACSTAARTSSK